MTEHFVTLFDRGFLIQGLGLYHSLTSSLGDAFVLWVLCLDEEVEQALSALALPGVQLLALASHETTELLAVKAARSRAEYCWTLTPWSIQWVFEACPTAERVTYVDADLYFLKSPQALLSEFAASGKEVLITEHGYAPECDMSLLSGKYCVQIVSFSRSASRSLLLWWRDRCLEWCYARFEEGRFGDQRYLEQFEDHAPGRVFALGPDARLQAPWNSAIFCCSEAVVYHFHGLRWLSESFVLLCDYRLPQVVLNQIYLPYVACLKRLSLLYGVEIRSQAQRPSACAVFVERIKKKLVDRHLRVLIPPFYARLQGEDWRIW